MTALSERFQTPVKIGAAIVTPFLFLPAMIVMLAICIGGLVWSAIQSIREPILPRCEHLSDEAQLRDYLVLFGAISVHLRECSKHFSFDGQMTICAKCESFVCLRCGKKEATNISLESVKEFGIDKSGARSRLVCELIAQGERFAELHGHIQAARAS